MDNLTLPPLTMSTTKANFTVTGGAATTFVTTTGAATQISYLINGKSYAKTPATGIAMPAVDVNSGNAFVPLNAGSGTTAQPVAYGTIFVFGLDAGGNYRVAQSKDANVLLDSAGNFIYAPQFPVLPDSIAPFGYLVVKGAFNSAAWTLGTSNWNATGITTSTQDVGTLTNRPQVA